MTTADWALVVSLCSFGVALASFVWNVWSKFLYPRAKVRASIAVMMIFDGDGSPARRFVQISATNYGPTEITLHGHQAKRRQGLLWFKTNSKLALINSIAHPDFMEPAGFIAPGFPKKLNVGESAAVYVSAQSPKRWIDEEDLYYFGFSDTFGRHHWCSRANARKFRRDCVEDFGAIEPYRPSLIELAKASAVRLWTQTKAVTRSRIKSIKAKLHHKA